MNPSLVVLRGSATPKKNLVNPCWRVAACQVAVGVKELELVKVQTMGAAN